MRLLVVSRPYLSPGRVGRLMRRIHDWEVVGQVESLAEAQVWCAADKTDAVLADAELIADQVIDDDFDSAMLVARVQSTFAQFASPNLDDEDFAAPVFRISTEQVTTLSSREREIFFLLGVGFSNRRIARRLEIAESTVKSHISQILGKLDISSRLEAGLAALAYLLIPHDGRQDALGPQASVNGCMVSGHQQLTSTGTRRFPVSPP